MRNYFFIFLALGLIIGISSCKKDEDNPDPIKTTITVTDVTTFGGSDGKIDLSVEGGTQPYTFLWSNGETTDHLENLTAGEYSVVVTDNEGVTKSDTAEVKQPSNPGDGDGDGDGNGNLTVEEHKDNLATTAIDFMNEMNDLLYAPAVEAALNAVYHMTMEEDEADESSLKKSAAVAPLVQLADYGNKETSALELLMSLKYAMLSETGNTEIEQEYIDNIAGTYTWDIDGDSLIYEEGSKLIVNFPATINSGSNNAVFTVQTFDWTEITGDIYDGELVEVPVSISANLKIDGNVEMSLSFTGSYNSEGVPESLNVNLTIGTYVFSLTLSNTTTEASATYLLKHGSTQVVKVTASVNGDFSEANIEDNVYTEQGDPWCVDYNWETGMCIEWEYDEWTEVNLENILYGASGSIQILDDIQFIGEVDVDDLWVAMDEIDYDQDQQDYAQDEADAMNEYMDFHVAYITDNVQIAYVDFYVYEDEEWDEYYAEPRLLFEDETTVDLEVFFDDEAAFGAVIDELNSMINELSSTYADYGADEMEEIDKDDVFSK